MRKQVGPRQPNADMVTGLHALIQQLKELKYAFAGIRDGKGERVEVCGVVSPRAYNELLRELRLTTKLVAEAAQSRLKIPQRCHHLVKAMLVTESSMLKTSVLLMEARLQMLEGYGAYPVSYTHLTLPTIYSV